jgi:hypothetical protein
MSLGPYEPNLARINRISMLTCAFAIVASALWTPNGASTVATGESAALPVGITTLNEKPTLDPGKGYSRGPCARNLTGR